MFTIASESYLYELYMISTLNQVMQTFPNNTITGQGVVQWVVPPQTKKAKKDQFKTQQQNNSAPETSNHNNSNTDDSFYSKLSNQSKSDDSGIREDYSIRSSSHSKCDTETSLLDISLCRTICVFVDQHIKELAEHQKSINIARSKINNNSIHDVQPTYNIDTSNYIAHNDISKLKVRDEQTKAIETIKQLTNYLKELTNLKKQFESSDDKSRPIDEDTVNKLLEARTRTIQALNNFVLSNYDIDIPIVDSEDIINSEYDLCTDVHTRHLSQPVEIEKFQDSDAFREKEKSIDKNHITAREPPFVIINDDGHLDYNSQRDDQYHFQQSTVIATNSDQFQINNLEKHKREIRKLERDTVELRRLFSDFYNLVKIQGEQVDSIENNIVNTTHRISEGQHNLNKAMKSLTFLVPATGCITGALIGGPLGLAIGGKLGGITIGCATSLLGLLSSYTAHKKIVSQKLCS